MSIAVDEARKYVAEVGDCMGADEAYCAGRTALATDAEVEEATIELYRQDLSDVRGVEQTTEQARKALYSDIGSDDTAQNTRAVYHQKARMILEAARRRVTE